MAIQEREDMKIAMKLKQRGWLHDILDINTAECQERAEWCKTSLGPMYQDLYSPLYFEGEGKWYGAVLPFQTGAVTPNRQFVFMFRDEKLYNMYKMMFSEKERNLYD